MGQDDLGYRSLFSFPRMVEELVREFVAEPWVHKLDFTTLKRVNASYVSEKLRKREGDLLWKLRRLDDGRPVYVYILIEHQSKVDRFMALRLMTYLSLLYQDLVKEGELTPDGLLPLVIPLVIYNGNGEWGAPLDLAELIERVDAASEVYVPHLRYRVIDEGRYDLGDLASRDSVVAQVFWLEKSLSPDALAQSQKRLVPLLSGPEDEPLRRAMLGWVDEALAPRRRRRKLPAGSLELEEFGIMLAKRVEEWSQQIREETRVEALKEGEQKGLQKGLQKGRQEGETTLLLRLLERKFGRLDARTRKLVRGADPQRLLSWADRVLTAERLEDVFAEDV